MAPGTKLSISVADLGEARALVGALEALAEPAPDAVTLFADGPAAWRVEAYYAEPPDVEEIGRRLAGIVERPVPPLKLSEVPERNWVAVSQAALPPVAAGRFTVHGSHDRGRIPHGPNAILIDAGEAFGTAHHATTQGCLLALDALARTHAFRRVLDLGCGSGVLAIAAARALPRADILATDSDPAAVAVAAANVRANGAGRRIAVLNADGLAHPRLRAAATFDLVIANILAGPLCALAAGLRQALEGGGVLVLSGLLEREAPAVVAAYRAQGFAVARHRRIEGWSTLTLIKRR